MNDPGDEAEKWFYNLETIAKRVNRNFAVTAVLFAMIVIVGIVSGLALQRQQDTIEREARLDRFRAYQTCLTINSNAVRLNRFVDQIIAAVRVSTVLTAQEKKTRTKSYAAIKADLPVCNGPR